MRACRFLSLLIFAVALDLAVPVAPTSVGVEFEEDEEVIHVGGVRVAKPAPATAPRPDTAVEDGEHTVRTAAPGVPIARHAAGPRTHVARSSPLRASPATASAGEDH